MCQFLQKMALGLLDQLWGNSQPNITKSFDLWASYISSFIWVLFNLS